MPKAAVLPVPVLAWPITSKPSRASGISAAWIGDGMTYRMRPRARSMGFESPMEANPGGATSVAL